VFEPINVSLPLGIRERLRRNGLGRKHLAVDDGRLSPRGIIGTGTMANIEFADFGRRDDLGLGRRNGVGHKVVGWASQSLRRTTTKVDAYAYGSQDQEDDEPAR